MKNLQAYPHLALDDWVAVARPDRLLRGLREGMNTTPRWADR